MKERKDVSKCYWKNDAIGFVWFKSCHKPSICKKKTTLSVKQNKAKYNKRDMPVHSSIQQLLLYDTTAFSLETISF